ncbi:MAG TPA: hypothetical protein CFH82_02900 [Sulfurospirillum sp. UBA12182]|nr:MAG TPA: hypothetical protein CFH82_02900 [Sulfurospirillum sp. UBA12182]
MAQDQIFTLKTNDGEIIIPIPIALDKDNKIFLCQVFEENLKLNKKYLRGQLIVVHNHVLTASVADTIHFAEELYLFDFGNSQNQYLSITEYQSTKNLKLIYDGKNDVFISKSKARAIYKIYNMSYIGYSVAAMLENEYKFTPQTLTKLLHHYKLFLK